MFFSLRKKGMRNRIFQGFLFVLFFIVISGIQTVSSKASHFLEIGNKVYFRKFGKNALPKTMIWYDYLTEPTWEKGSFVAVYDKKTKKVSKAFDDNGGSLWFADNRFYTTYKDEVYSVDKKGRSYKKISDSGFLRTVINKKYVVVDEYDKSVIVKGGKRISEITPSVDLMDDHYGIYSVRTGEFYDSYIEIWCKDLKVQTPPVLLGTIELQGLGMDADDYSLIEMVRKNSNIYFSMTLYTGNAHYLNGGCIYKANPKKKNSLKLVRTDLVKNSIIQAFSVDKNGKVKTFVGGDYTTNSSWIEGNKLYTYLKNGNKRLVTKDFPKLLRSKGGDDIEYHISTEQMIDGNLFMLVNKQKRNPSKDIGWKMAYDIMERYYVRIPIKNVKNTQILYRDVFK